jgi:hypothetical protein
MYRGQKPITSYHSVDPFPDYPPKCTCRCQSRVRILTSGDDAATQTLMTLAHENRSLLGAKWWRLLYLALLWSGLSILAPRFDESPSMQLRWNRWLRWLRSRNFIQPNATSDCIDPLAIARRVERLERRRWIREYARKDSLFGRSPEGRRSSGLDTHLLERIFGWVLRDGPEEQSMSLEAGERQKLLKVLVAFELWHRHTKLDEKGRDAPPSHLGYKLLSTMAQLARTTSLMSCAVPAPNACWHTGMTGFPPTALARSIQKGMAATWRASSSSRGSSRRTWNMAASN